VDNISPSMDLHPSIIYTICLPALSLIKSDTLVNIMYNPTDHSDWIWLITTDASAKLTAVKIKSDLQIRFEDQSMQLASLATGFNNVYMNVCDTAIGHCEKLDDDYAILRTNHEYISEYITPVPLWNALSGEKTTPDDFMKLLTINIHSLDESLVENYSEAFPEALTQLSATEFSEFCRFCTGSYRPTSAITADIYARDDQYIRSHTCANSFDVPHKSCKSNDELAIYLRDMIRRTLEQQLRQEADGNGFTLA
jgi:hypothetical protein